MGKRGDYGQRSAYMYRICTALPSAIPTPQASPLGFGKAGSVKGCTLSVLLSIALCLLQTPEKGLGGKVLHGEDLRSCFP